MRRMIGTLLVVPLALLCACSRRPSPEQGRAQLVGNYELRIGNDCADRGIEYARLSLRQDGTFSQVQKFKDGTTYFSNNDKWDYSDRHVSLDGLRVNNTLEFAPNASPGFASLIVEFGEPTVILLSPGQNCFFVKAD